MTYGRWLDDSHTALIGAQAAMAQVTAVGYADAAEVVSERDRCLRALIRLVGLVSGVTQTRGSSRPVDLDAAVINTVKDPTARMLLRAMPRAFTTPARHGDEPRRWVTATFLRSAADNASVAADILASHIDPTNGPRTPQGAAVRLGAGRTAALAEFAVVMTEFVNVDRHLAACLDSGAMGRPPAAAVIHADTIEALRSWSTSGNPGTIAAIATMSREPGIVRQLEVASVLQQPDLPRTPNTVAECGELIEDFRLWAFRHPNDAGVYHVSAATRVGLLITTALPHPTDAARHGWREAAQALSQVAARQPLSPDLRATELGHIADLLRTDPTTFDPDELSLLGTRLPGLADTIDTVTRHAVRHGALLTKKTTIDTATTRAGVFRAIGSWVPATLDDPAVEALLAGLGQAASPVQHAASHTPSRVQRAFPKLSGTLTGTPSQLPDCAQNTPQAQRRR
ncbi:MAG: hypothetical protein QOE61_5798 [Micromonosporaceae bacterium]|jgi:hypothetical protein|nr:hypothetical protein [Micromonosporaceae bacterium]